MVCRGNYTTGNNKQMEMSEEESIASFIKFGKRVIITKDKVVKELKIRLKERAMVADISAVGAFFEAIVLIEMIGKPVSFMKTKQKTK